MYIHTSAESSLIAHASIVRHSIPNPNPQSVFYSDAHPPHTKRKQFSTGGGRGSFEGGGKGGKRGSFWGGAQARSFWGSEGALFSPSPGPPNLKSKGAVAKGNATRERARERERGSSDPRERGKERKK